MHGYAGRFIDDQHQSITIQEAGEQIFFCHECRIALSPEARKLYRECDDTK
jgi:hypothetical protein